MKIVTIPPQGVFAVNSYLAVSDAGNAALIDAPQGADRLLAEVTRQGAVLRKILLTHGHCDHIEALAEVARRTGAEVYVHALDAPKLTDSYYDLSEFFADYLDKSAEPYDKAMTVRDGDTVTMDELSFRVLHTPGHTGGSVCYLLGDVIFSGDTLFRDSIGRTDMPDGDEEKLRYSLKKLRDFQGEYPDYRLLSGHGGESTLSRERERNPYLSERFLGH